MESDKISPDVRRNGSRVGARRVVLAALTAAMLAGTVGAASGNAGGALLQTSPPGDVWAGGRKLGPPPDGPWPRGAEFSISLCAADGRYGTCRRRVITDEQRRALQARLEAMPEVAQVAFESRAQAWANLQERHADDKEMLEMAGTLVSDSFKGRLHRRVDARPFEAAMKKVPGVSLVVMSGGRFWEGKADIAVTLCGKQQPDDGPCAKRGPATRQETAALEGRLSALRQVQQVYVEDAAHARRALEHMWIGGKFRPSVFPADHRGYYIRLTDPGDARTVIAVIEEMPGVEDAYTVGAG
ncbi:permease-like cell division protein FtsX [Planomonospora sphaerica]|uniref:permease-like cell division protein FtsX n=1 Tax=Planomonospora sphaerica TaxID=161355 RepID=UPI001290660F|nr:permease-like cell division protein FtsX [Planomonospora sphaerica]